MIVRSFWILCAGLLLAPGCSPVRGYCEASRACDEFKALLDFVGNDTDSADVCTAQVEAELRALRANEEQICQDEATAYEAYMDCVARHYASNEEDACGGLRLLDDTCQKEREQYLSYVQNDEQKCSSGEHN